MGSLQLFKTFTCLVLNLRVFPPLLCVFVCAKSTFVHLEYQPRCAEIDYSHTAAAAAQGELGDAAPATGWDQLCILCPIQTGNHSVRQRKMDGRRKRNPPAASEHTSKSSGTCCSRFFFLNLKLAWASAKTQDAHMHAHMHARTQSMRISHCENQPINCFHTVNRIKPSNCQVAGPESAQIQEGTAARCGSTKEEDRGQLLVGKAGWVKISCYCLLLDALLVRKEQQSCCHDTAVLADCWINF